MNATLRVAPLTPLRLASVEVCFDSANTVIDGSSRTARVPPIKQPLALGVVSTRFRAPQAKGAEKEILEMYLYIQFRSSVSSAMTWSDAKRVRMTQRSLFFRSPRSGHGRMPTTSGPRKPNGIASSPGIAWGKRRFVGSRFRSHLLERRFWLGARRFSNSTHLPGIRLSANFSK